MADIEKPKSKGFFGTGIELPKVGWPHLEISDEVRGATVTSIIGIELATLLIASGNLEKMLALGMEATSLLGIIGIVSALNSKKK